MSWEWFIDKEEKAMDKTPSWGGILWAVFFAICIGLTIGGLMALSLFAQSGQVVRREVHYSDAAGTPASIFFAFSLSGLPSHPGESGYREFWIVGDEFKQLPGAWVNGEPDATMEAAIQVIVNREIENAMVSWERELAGRPKPRRDALDLGEGRRKETQPVAVDLQKARDRVAEEEASRMVSTTTTTTASGSTTTTRPR